MICMNIFDISGGPPMPGCGPKGIGLRQKKIPQPAIPLKSFNWTKLPDVRTLAYQIHFIPTNFSPFFEIFEKFCEMFFVMVFQPQKCDLEQKITSYENHNSNFFDSIYLNEIG